MIRFFFVTVALLGCLVSNAQQNQAQDTVRTNPADAFHIDSTNVVKIQNYAARFSPRKALLYSAILPGAGQVYNKKYWKVPIVYLFIGTGIWYVSLNDGEYRMYKSQLFSILNEPTPAVVDKDGLTPSGNLLVNGALVNAKNRLGVDQLRNQVNRFRRDRDFGLMMTGLIYFLQMIDAHVDAHLKEFDVNPQLKLSLEPSHQAIGLYGRASGVSIKFTF